MKKLLLLLLLSFCAQAAEQVKISALTKSAVAPTNTLLLTTVTVSGVSTNTYAMYLETLIRAGITNTSTLAWEVIAGKLVGYPTNIATAQISASAGILGTQLEAAIIVSTEIDTIGEIETLAAGVNIIISTEIDTEAEVEALSFGGGNVLKETDIDTQAEFEALLFTLPGAGSGDDVFVNGSDIVNPDFDDDTYVKHIVTGTNVVTIVTNLVNAHIAAGAAIAATKLEAAVIVLTEIDTESEIETLSFGGGNVLKEVDIDTQSEFEALLFTLPSGGVAGSMINTGASTQYALPRYSDTTGTNLAPSLLLTDATGTNFFVGQLNIGTLVVTNSPAFDGLTVNPLAYNQTTWNTSTNVPTRGDIRDYVSISDTDGDGLPNIVEPTGTAGFNNVDTSGIFQTPVAGSGTGSMIRAAAGVFTDFRLPTGNDPDVAAAGQMGHDANGGTIRIFDNSIQKAIKTQEAIHFTVVLPNDLADSERDAFWIWENVSGMSFVVTGWSFKSDTDDTTLNIEEIDTDGQNNVTVDAVEIATNGTGLFYATDTTITAATIETGHILVIDFDDTDVPGQVKGTIYGYYAADVN